MTTIEGTTQAAAFTSEMVRWPWPTPWSVQSDLPDYPAALALPYMGRENGAETAPSWVIALIAVIWFDHDYGKGRGANSCERALLVCSRSKDPPKLAAAIATAHMSGAAGVGGPPNVHVNETKMDFVAWQAFLDGLEDG